MAACEELGHEAGVEGVKVDGGHVVDGERDLLLQQVVALVEQHLQQHVDEVEQHGGPEQLLENKTGFNKKWGSTARTRKIVTLRQFETMISMYIDIYISIFITNLLA